MSRLIVLSNRVTLPNPNATQAGGLAVALEDALNGIGGIGGSMDDVTFNHVFVKDWADYAAINTVYAEYFPGDKPARYCVQTGLVKPDALVEIASIAHV